MSKNIIQRAWEAFTRSEDRAPSISQPQARVSDGAGRYNIVGGITFTGEKNIGEMGEVKVYSLGYAVLRARSWQLYLESETVKIISRKYITWMIGAGLKLQAEPMSDIIEDEGGKIDTKEFSRKVEQRWKLFTGSKKSSHDKQKNLNQIAGEAFKNAIVSGDVLVILRVEEEQLTIQLVDGDHVVSPMFGTESFPQDLKNGHRIINGIEVDKKGEHHAYYVRKEGGYNFETERIPARGEKTGMLMAFMVYGDKYRIDNYRGLPLMAVMFETAKKLERYKEATVGSAEERQKIALFVEHQAVSTGENPFLTQTARASNVNDSMGMPEDDYGNQLQNRVTATTNKQAINMPVGSTIKTVEGKQELYFKDFFGANFDLASASAEMPPNVALSKYDSNFSASRAALKDWENTLRVGRYYFAMDFYQPIYEFWLEMQILMNKIKADGYLEARIKNNETMLAAFRNARYVGSPVPHIDPVKEVQAERLKLGVSAAHVPLTTVEAATEAIGGGDSESNIEQFEEELKECEEFKPEIPDPMGKPTGKPKE